MCSVFILSHPIRQIPAIFLNLAKHHFHFLPTSLAFFSLLDVFFIDFHFLKPLIQHPGSI